ncbi:MAG: DUF4360 domain-containing protein [Polyangiales bacterium]
MNLTHVLLRVSAVLTLCVGGCAVGAELERVPAATDEPLALADPAATTFASVKAHGSGCPVGTSATSISRDGLAFTTTFASYITQVDTSVDVSVRECQLEISLHTPEGRSYAVQELSYSGFALLQDGMIGRQTANYYFQGNPAMSVESNRTELTGPHDNAYLFVDKVRVEDRVWSPCGVERNLNVVTRVQLFNSSPRRSGFLNLTSVDGSSKLELVLASRPCEGVQPPRKAPLAKVGKLTVTPPTIERDQPFAVRWVAPPENAEATYTVQLRTHERAGDALVWESQSTRGSASVYDGQPIEAAGSYQIVVIAKRGDEEARSDRMGLEVRDIANAAPTLGKPTALRVSPSPIVRDAPFLVTWVASENATATTTYRVELRDVAGAVVATAPETSVTVAALPANATPRDGTYRVVVIARSGDVQVASDPLTVVAGVRKDETGPPPPVTSPAARLAGRYAMRSVAYSFGSSGSRGSLKELQLVDIAEGPRGLEMRSTLCFQETKSLGFSFVMGNPDAYPPLTRDIKIDGDRWYTEGGPFSSGYERDGVAACRGRAGQYVQKQPQQRWISNGSCRCPTSPATIPRADDCRVNDPDGDGNAGLAYRWYGPGGTFDYTSHLVTVQRSHLRAGTIADDGRHTAELRYDEMGYEMSCEGALCRAGSNLSFQPCVSRHNPAQLVPLPDPPAGQPRWTCSALRSAEARVFQRALPPAPTRCDVEALTDPLP